MSNPVSDWSCSRSYRPEDRKSNVKVGIAIVAFFGVASINASKIVAAGSSMLPKAPIWL